LGAFGRVWHQHLWAIGNLNIAVNVLAASDEDESRLGNAADSRGGKQRSETSQRASRLRPFWTT
jgi:hypothetical protein